MILKTWNIEALTGYKPQTTFYKDFSIADAFGVSAIKDTYKRGLETAKMLGRVYLTEFVMALNWKIWEHYNSNEKYATLYDELWQKAQDVALDTLQGEDLDYYFETID